MDRTVKLWWVTNMKYSAWPHCSHHSLNLAGDIWFLNRIFSLISGYFCRWSNLGKMSVCTLYFQGNCCMHLITWILKIFWSDNVLLRPNVLIEWCTGLYACLFCWLASIFFGSLQPTISLRTDRKVFIFYLFMLPQAV